MGEISPIGRKRTPDALIGASYYSSSFTISEMGSIYNSAPSVALIKVRRFRQGKMEHEETGTGWLIAPGLLLTCWHVVATLMDPDELPPEAVDIQYQLDDMLVFFNLTESEQDSTDYRVEKLEFKSTPEQDFALLRLAKRDHTPFERFRYLPIELDPPLTTQTQLFIIQHPRGGRQEVAIGGSYRGQNQTEFPARISYTTETQPGTSGAPVLRRQNGRVIAIHNEKIVDGVIYNEGTRINAILNILQTQAPKLYGEIMDAQRKLNKNLASPLPAADIAPSPQQQLHAASSPVVSPIQDRGTRNQPALEREKRLQHYTHAADCTSTAPILCLTFDPTGKELLYGARSDGIHRADATTLRPIASIKTCTKAVPCLALSPDGKYIGSGGDDGSVTLWQWESGQLRRYKTLQAHNDWVSCVAFSANGHYLLSGGDDGTLSVLDTLTRSVQRWQRSAGIRALTCHPQQELSASCGVDQPPILWHFTRENHSDLPELLKSANCLLFHPTGRYLVGGNAAGALIVYDMQSQSLTTLPPHHTRTIRCLAFHPEGTLMASGGDDQAIRLWDILAGKHVQTLPGHSGRITGLAFSPDGHFLASSGQDTKLFVWKAS